MIAAFDSHEHIDICQLLIEQNFGPALAELEAIEQEAWEPGADMDLLAQELRGRPIKVHVDTVLILSGDGDFAALVQEVAARGRRIYVGAFSKGFNPKLSERADLFIDLDPIFFEPRRAR